MLKSSKFIKGISSSLIVLIIMFVVVGCGAKKKSANATNTANNPLYGQKITFKEAGDDHHLSLSEDSRVRIAAKATLFTMKKQGPKLKITKFMEKHLEQYVKYRKGDYMDNKKMEDKISKLENEAAQQPDDKKNVIYINDYYEKMLSSDDNVISNTYAKEGKNVTIRIPYDEYEARKHGVFEKAFKYAPRKVKVRMTSDDE